MSPIAVAVEEHLLDEVLPRQVGHGAGIGCEGRIHRQRPRAQPPQCALADCALALGLRVRGVIRRPDVVKLDVEDEDGPASHFFRCRRVGRLGGRHIEEPAEHRVHGQKRGHHPAAGAQKLSSAEPEPRGQAPRLGEDPLLHLPLCGGLRERLELLVGDQPGRDRRLGLVSAAHAGANAECKRVQLHHLLL